MTLEAFGYVAGGAVASIEALPEVVEEIGDDIPVLFDSGIRRGANAVKALALGARAVLLGRSYAYGLAVGVADAVRGSHIDPDLTLYSSGHRNCPPAAERRQFPVSGRTAELCVA